MISTQNSDGIHQEVVYRSVPGVLKFADIFQFIINTFDDYSFMSMILSA